MSVFTDLKAAGKKVEDFIVDVVHGGEQLLVLFKALSGPTRAVILAVAYDAYTSLVDAKDTAADVAKGDLTDAYTMSQTTITAFKKLIADAKSGEATIVADFKALNWKI